MEEYVGVSPGSPHSSSPWDLSLILSNRYFTDTAKIEKGGKTMPYFFLISWVNIFSHFILGLGLKWNSFINLQPTEQECLSTKPVNGMGWEMLLFFTQENNQVEDFWMGKTAALMGHIPSNPWNVSSVSVSEQNWASLGSLQWIMYLQKNTV